MRCYARSCRTRNCVVSDVTRAGAEDFPEDLLGVDQLEQVIAFLRAVPLPITSKRQKLWMWAKAHGVQLDPSYYARLGSGGVS